ncbi:MAG TPA: carbohydrate kinase family protein [Candidatus Peribacteraceae bacterium]|nr:carbohydrate kinase family protein [Candidatus Peribacteraceae bacterium]
MKQPKVLVVGNNTIDLVFVCERGPSLGEKGQALEFRCISGGQAANVAVALRRLGVPVEYVGCFGDDQYGELSKESLRACGVELSRCITRPSCPQHLASITVSATEAERTIVMYKDKRIFANDIEPDQSWLKGVAIVYTDGHELMLSDKLAILAQICNIPMLADAENEDAIRGLLPKISSLIAPSKVIQRLVSDNRLESAIAAASELGPNIVIATMGARGSIGFSRDNGIARVAAEACEVMDTTGAGDAYHAGYIAAVLSGSRMEEAMRVGAKVASVACESLGPRVESAQLEQKGLLDSFVSNLTYPKRGIYV